MGGLFACWLLTFAQERAVSSATVDTVNPHHAQSVEHIPGFTLINSSIKSPLPRLTGVGLEAGLTQVIKNTSINFMASFNLCLLFQQLGKITFPGPTFTTEAPCI